MPMPIETASFRAIGVTGKCTDSACIEMLGNP
jgi:hypothetical protein